MATKTRKSISKKLRFEVFKRDSFTCQYCGEKAPNVVLELDHIDSVKNGGKNDILNLITSCFDCNRGKSDKKLSENLVLDKQLIQLELLNEKKEQLKLMVKWKKELLSIEHDTLSEIEKHWISLTGCGWNNLGEKSVKSWIKKYGFSEIIEAMNISYDRYIFFDKDGKVTDKSWGIAFDKIGGILYYRNLNELEVEVEKIKMFCKRKFDDYSAIGMTQRIKEFHLAGGNLNKLFQNVFYASSFSEVLEYLNEGNYTEE